MLQVVLCQYYIQNEVANLGSKKQLLNAFVIPKKVNNIKEVSVSDVKDAFPFDSHLYHFRFQTKMANMKVWVDTSKDSVAVPNIDGKIKMKLLKLPTGVKVKPPKIIPQTSENAADPVFTKATSEKQNFKNDEGLGPSKSKPMHHSNSYNNITDSAGINEPKQTDHKPMSQPGENDLIGDLGDDSHHKGDINGMDFNINTDDIFGGGDSNKNPSGHDDDNLLGDFDTNNNSTPSHAPEPSSNVFDLGDLGGVDFNMGPSKVEESKGTGKPTSLIDHVTDIHNGAAKEQEEMQMAYKKFDHRIKMWKGEPSMHSIKILL